MGGRAWKVLAWNFRVTAWLAGRVNCATWIGTSANRRRAKTGESAWISWTDIYVPARWVRRREKEEEEEEDKCLSALCLAWLIISGSVRPMTNANLSPQPG